MTTPRFTHDHADALLTFITSVDHRFTVTDPALGAARRNAWQIILADVDPDYALGYVRRWYSKAGQDRVTPAGIRSAWIGEQRRAAERTRDRLPASSGPPVGVRDYLREVLAAVSAGRPPDSVPVPAGMQITPAMETASRKCRNARGVAACACDHTKCRDGWLDEEQTITSVHGRKYQQVVPCPYCRDAALMAAEFATPTHGRRR